jgi:dipeptidyl aminopeptidase/acylaminoacyl peptidase
MTMRTDFDRTLAAWLADERPEAAPEGLLEAVTTRVAQTPRRPGWLILDRWTWSWSASRARSTARVAALAAAVILLIVAAVAAVILVGSPRPAPPFGLARAGLIAFDAAEGVVVARVDGSERRVVSTEFGQGVSPTWSRDGLRLAFWSRAGEGDPWDLTVWDPNLDRFERLANGVTLREREAVFGWPSNLSWSPDSQRIAFAADIDARDHGIFVATVGEPGPVLITVPEVGGIDPA